MKKVIIIGLTLIIALISLFILFINWPNNLQRLQGQEVIGEYLSPNEEYTVITYRNSGGATTDFAVLGTVVNNSTSAKRNIYWQYHCSEASVEWIDNETVSINGRTLNIEKDYYDYREYALDYYDKSYEDWQTIKIPDIGKIKLPKEWIVTQKGDLVYISNKSIEAENCQIYLLGSITDDATRSSFTSPEASEDLQQSYSIQMFNNSIYGAFKYIDGHNIYFINLSSPIKTINFISHTDSIDEETIHLIAYSFKSIKTKDQL